MFKALMNGLLSAVNQLINLITLPIDTLINAAFPDLSSTIQTGVNSVVNVLDNISYAIGFLPVSFITILVLIFTIQISFIVLNKSVNSITRIYKLIQKIKFW